MEHLFFNEVIGLTVDHYVAVVAVEMGAHTLVHVVRAVVRAYRRLREKGRGIVGLSGDPPNFQWMISSSFS